MRLIKSSPKKDGYRMPGEFEPHDGTWMLWPQRPDVWRFGGKPAQAAFVEVATAISKFEQVTMGVSCDQYENACNMLPENIRIVEISNDDSWMRDCGPTFVKNADGDVRGVDWCFNSWGGLEYGAYFPWDKDIQVCRKVCEIEKKDMYKLLDFVIEGGSIHSDGDGTALVTEECLLNPGRNPNLNKQQIEDNLKEYLNVEKVIWLKRGIYLDETNGHVDNICCFARPGEVFLAWTEDKSDPQYEISAECLEILENTIDAKGRKVKVHKLIVPKPVLITAEEGKGVDVKVGSIPRVEGERLAASYVNFSFVNGGIVMPLFNDPSDALALAKMQEVYPDRKVIGVYAREILLGGGNIHCITQQQPKAGK
ncbi:MAG: agmatine deiminase [Oscillospiraceae bacterium]